MKHFESVCYNIDSGCSVETKTEHNGIFFPIQISKQISSIKSCINTFRHSRTRFCTDLIPKYRTRKCVLCKRWLFVCSITRLWIRTRLNWFENCVSNSICHLTLNSHAMKHTRCTAGGIFPNWKSDSNRQHLSTMVQLSGRVNWSIKHWMRLRKLRCYILWLWHRFVPSTWTVFVAKNYLSNYRIIYKSTAHHTVREK